MATELASQEIEETIRHGRDEAERQIASYRVLLLSVAIALTAGLHLFASVPWTPVVTSICGLAYALALRLVIVRRGVSFAVICTVAVVDMLFAGATFVLTRLLNDDGALPPAAANYPIYILPALLFFLSLINSLRYSRTAALLGGATAVMVFFGCEIWLVGFVPAQIVTGALLALAGGVVFVSAVRTRQSLARFARLQLLRRYLSPAAIERVLMDSPDEALALGGELRTVTLLAADLRDFTAMSERLSAQEVVAQLNEYHGVMLAEIDRAGGVLDKFIGDGTLAVFGLLPREPQPPDAGAAAAVACARAMREALERLNFGRAGRGLPPLRMGIGVHTGPVVAGNIGAPGRRIEFTVIGDSVNTAARLEGLTKEAGVPVLISAATASRLKSHEGLHALPAMHAKGKETMIEVLAMTQMVAAR